MLNSCSILNQLNYDTSSYRPVTLSDQNLVLICLHKITYVFGGQSEKMSVLINFLMQNTNFVSALRKVCQKFAIYCASAHCQRVRMTSPDHSHEVKKTTEYRKWTKGDNGILNITITNIHLS
jgi:hypothetical protein